MGTAVWLLVTGALGCAALAHRTSSEPESWLSPPEQEVLVRARLVQEPGYSSLYYDARKTSKEEPYWRAEGQEVAEAVGKPRKWKKSSMWNKWEKKKLEGKREKRSLLVVDGETLQRQHEADVEILRRLSEGRRQWNEEVRRQDDAIRVATDNLQIQQVEQLRRQIEADRRVNYWPAVHLRKRRSTVLVSPAHPLFAPQYVVGQPQINRAVADHNARVIDQVQIGQIDATQRVLDNAGELANQAQWVGRLVNEAAINQGQRQVEAVQEVNRAVADHNARVVDQVQIGQIDATQHVLDATVERANQAQWVSGLINDAAINQGQRQVEAVQEVNRAVADHNARVIDQVQIGQTDETQQVLDTAVERVNQAQWVSGLINDAAINQGQRQVEAVQEVNRAVADHNARVVDQVQIGQIDGSQRVLDSVVEQSNQAQWVNGLINEAVQNEGQRQIQAVQEVNSAVADHNARVIDQVQISQTDATQQVLDTAVERANQAEWVGRLVNEAAINEGQRQVEAVADHNARVVDQVQRGQIDATQQVLDTVVERANQAQWVNGLVREAVENEGQRQIQAVQEVNRAVADVQADAIDQAERTRLAQIQHAIDSQEVVRQGEWIGQLSAEAVQREGQRQAEVVQEVGRAIGDHNARVIDQVRIGQIDLTQRALDNHGELNNQAQWVGRLVNEAALREGQRQAEVGQEVVRIVNGQAQLGQLALAQHVVRPQAQWVVPHAPHGLRLKRSVWLGQLLNEAALREGQRRQEVGQEIGRIVNEQNGQIVDQLQRGRLAVQQHVIDSAEVGRQAHWVGQLVNEAVNREGQRQLEVGQEIARSINDQNNGIRDAVQISQLGHRQIVADNTQELGRRAHWVGQWANEAAQTEGQRQLGIGQEIARIHNEQVRQIHDIHSRGKRSVWGAQLLTQVPVLTGLGYGEISRAVADNNARVVDQVQIGQLAARQHVIDTTAELGNQARWVGDLVNQAALREGQRQGEIVQEVGRAVVDHNARVVDQVQIGQLNGRQLAIDGAVEHVNQARWVGDLVNQAALREGQRQGEIAQEVGRAVVDHNARVVDSAQIGILGARQHVIDSNVEHVNQARWVGDLVNQAALREGQRQGEVVQEVGRIYGEQVRQLHDLHSRGKRSVWGVQLLTTDAAVQAGLRQHEAVQEVNRAVADHNARVIDRVQIGQNAVTQLAIDQANELAHQARWVGDLVNTRQIENAQEVGRIYGEQIRAVHDLHTRGKRSVWGAQLLTTDAVVQAGLRQHEAVQEVNRAVADHNARVIDRVQIGQNAVTQLAIDQANELAHQARWVGDLVNTRLVENAQEVGRIYGEQVRAVHDLHTRGKRSVWGAQLLTGLVPVGQRQLEAIQEVNRAVVDHNARVVDNAQIGILGARQHVIDSNVEHVNQARWVGDLVNQAALREGQRQGEVVQEVGRVIANQNAQIVDGAQIGQLAVRQHVIDTNVELGNQARWVGDLVNQAALREGQRQGEIVQEVGRAVTDQHAQIVDSAQVGQLALRQHVIDSNVELGNQARWVGDLVNQRHGEIAREQLRALYGHGLRKKRSVWLDQVVNLNQAVADHNSRIVDQVRNGQLNLKQAVADHNSRVIDQAHIGQLNLNQAVADTNARVVDQVQIGQLAARQHVIDTNVELGNQAQWVGNLVREAALNEGQRQVDLAREIGRIHTGVLYGHGLRKRRSVWGVPLALDLNRRLVDQVQIGQLGARQQVIDSAVEHVNQARWVGDLVNQAALREGQRQGEVLQEVGRAVVDNNARVLDNAQIGQLALRQHAIDTNVELGNQARWVGNLVNEAALTEGQRQLQLGQEYSRIIYGH